MIKEYLFPPANPVGTLEDDHLVNFKTWFNHWYPDVYWFHVPNENGGKAESSIFAPAGEGVAQRGGGYRDPASRPQWRAVRRDRDETREQKLSTPVSKEQVECLSAVSAQGGFAAVAYGFDCAKLAVIDFLGPSPISIK